MSLSSDAVAKWLALIRIYAGAFWLIHAWPKWMAPETFMPPNGFLGGAVQKMTAESTGFYHTFLANTVSPNVGLFAELMRIGEAAVGISLLLGLLTRIGGLGGMFLALNYMLAKSAFSDPNGFGGLDAAAFVLSFINFVLPSGAVWSVDSVLGRGRRRRT